MKSRACIVLLILLFVVSGCATMSKRTDCIVKSTVAGATVGGLGGAAIDNMGDGGNEEDGALIGIAAGGIIGGTVGFLLCKDVGDADGDGVPDDMDKCPNTPFGVKVDENGCPIDSDGDGVPDSKDKCPNTPKGAKVDVNGCSDADGDGVPDNKDKCPNTPKGVKVDANGCPRDSDGDGVTDDKDKCPNTPKGAKVNANGCAVDSDRDGVPDYKDKCPNTPRGAKVDRNGCSLVGEKLLILQGVNFEFDSAKITQNSEAILDKAVNVLKDNPKVKVRIEGHTDSTGSEEYNLALSQWRANAVRDYLVSKGIASGRLSTAGKGEGSPITSNQTREGRSQNRRVEFVVTAK
jgi:outer membrane protein OmpA-like peptidoglycan-associated protein